MIFRSHREGRRAGRIVLWTLVLQVLSVPSAWSQEEEDDVPQVQFLERPPAHAYANYAESPFKPYRTRLRLEPRYDFFGQYLGTGYRAFRMDEQRPGKSVITKDEIYRSTFQNLLVTRSSYGVFNAALTVGDEIRHTLTPLTMQRAAFNGVRWEAEYPGHRLTFLASRGFDDTDFPGFKVFSTPVAVDPVRYDYNPAFTPYVRVEEENPVYTFGGRWETDLHPALTVGATVVNQQQLNSQADSKDGYLRGGVPFLKIQPPTSITLRLLDDSPEDRTGGAALFEVQMELEATVGGLDTLLSTDPLSEHYISALDPILEGGRRVNDHWEANGEDQIIVTFPVPTDITPRRARFRFVIANDYRIEVLLGQRANDPFYTLRRAPGNVRDFSNQTELFLDHGLMSGQTLYGANIAADLIGLKVRGEIAMNTLYRKFPVLEGHNADVRTRAWYVNVLKTFPDFHQLRVGGEFFYMGPRYGGGYDSRRGGVVLYGARRFMAEYPLVDDNDDGDRYADDNRNDFFGSRAKEAGVFPGLDEDNDNIPDNDRNANGIPDFEEPFLLYHADPQEFVYGLDMNNNGVIDARENDAKADYPYDRDRKGRHLTAELPLALGMTAGLGYYRMNGIADGGRATSRYLRAAYTYSDPKRVTVHLNHDSKRVKDSIPDPVYIFDTTGEQTPLDPPDPDPLLQRNSWVHTSFVGGRYTRLAPLNLETNVKRVYNRMFDLKNTAIPEKDTRVTYTMVNKVDYRWAWGRFVFKPMYKRLWQRQTLDSKRKPLVSTIRSAPILRVDYVISDEIQVQLGQQGIRLQSLGIDRRLAFRSIDKVERFRSFSATDFMLMLTIRTKYVGTSIVANSGIHRHKAVFDDPRVKEKRSFSRLFVEIVTGFERF